MQLLGGLLRAS